MSLRQHLKNKIVGLFLLSDMQSQLNFDQIQISWNAYHGKLSGYTQVLIDYTHLAFVWIGLIVYRSKQFSKLRDDFVKTIEQKLSNEEIDQIFINDIDKIPKENKSFAFSKLLSVMLRLHLPPS
ncbi:MAG: hypothetical protein AB8G05_02910 [Oligoflexales bacterium]